MPGELEDQCGWSSVNEGEGEGSWNQGGEGREEAWAGLCGENLDFILMAIGSHGILPSTHRRFQDSSSPPLPWLSIFILQVSPPTLTSSKRPPSDTPGK